MSRLGVDGEEAAGMMRERTLAGAVSELADLLVGDYDVADLLDLLVAKIVLLVDVAEAALLLPDQHGSLQVMASSDERAGLVELYQAQAGEGPCRDCHRTGEMVRVADLNEATTRWPRFARLALEQGYAAVHAIPLRSRDEVIGAVTLFGTTPGDLPIEALSLARALADVATIGIVHARAGGRRDVLVAQLEHALHSRIVIEQAKGVLAERDRTTVDEAFRALRDFARRNGYRLTDVAREVAERRLPPNPIVEGRTWPGRVGGEP
ncbi:GAF and ANTAR domain-containing protein [Pseudactinotalea sp. HY160]|uniref:GAF and ANTAR domain-containing protein n=1 Tax=Pseudactinotalea sp. HY160 TaxID=2654490 RepID=UPI00351BB97E